MEEEIDLDALLEGQSSDEDEGDLPELGRSIEEILDEADEGESSRSSVGFHDAVLVEFGGSVTRTELKKDQGKDVILPPELHKQDQGSGEVGTNFQGNSDNVRNWKSSSVGEAGSRHLTTSTSDFSLFQVLNPRPSLRPGTALAAATAASRPWRGRPPAVEGNISSINNKENQEDEAHKKEKLRETSADKGHVGAEDTAGEVHVDTCTSISSTEDAFEEATSDTNSENNYSTKGTFQEPSEKEVQVEPMSSSVFVAMDKPFEESELSEEGQAKSELSEEEQESDEEQEKSELIEQGQEKSELSENDLREEQSVKLFDECELHAEPVDVSASSDDCELEEDPVLVEVRDLLQHDEGLSSSEAEKLDAHGNQNQEKADGPLDAAEEIEKQAANSGIHLEEGAAAQPMQLEGIQRGPPAIGLLKLDWRCPLSSALSSTATVQEHGTPRALAVHKNYIAVGMSKGTVFLAASKYSPTSFADDNENKIAILSSGPDKSDASVSVLSFSNLWDLLLVGYSNGTLSLWDVTKAAVVKAVTGEHRSLIVHATFVGQDSSTGRQSKAITADCKGVVMLHTFILVPLLRRYTVTTQCIADGQRTGIVLSLSPLVSSGSALHNLSSSSGANDAGRRFLFDGSTDEVGGVVALVGQHSALVFRFVPAVEVCAKLARPKGVPEGSIPYTAWRSTTSSSEDSDSKYPLLALAWGKKVLVLQLQKTELTTLSEWELDSKATGIAWLGEQMLVLATGKAELLLFTKEGFELERAAIVDENGREEALTFHTHFLESCNNPEKVYANSIGVRGAAFYILGASRIWRARLLPWQDRIKALQDAGDWMGAFQIAMELFDGRARGVTGLPSGLQAMQTAIMSNLVGLLLSYVDEAFAYVRLALGDSEETGDPIQAGGEQYARVGRVAIEFCVHIKKTDVLFENVYEKFGALGQAGTFLELLEPYILKDMLGGLRPEIMQSLVEHYSSKGWLQRIEQCILHMDIASLDFNQVMRLCRDHGLFSALIYLFNKGLNDFISPLDELLAAAQDQRRANAECFGYKLLVYLKYCFSGLAFPPGRGHLPPEQSSRLKAQLLEYLLDPAGSGMESTYAVFPRLHYLLNFDVAATLEVFMVALEGNSTEKSQREKDLIQLTVDALVHIIETVLCMDSGSKSTIDHLLLFIAGIVSAGDAGIPPSTLHRILNLFLDSKESEREDLIVSLLKATPKEDWDAEHVLEFADKAHFWQVCAMVYIRRLDYVSALKSYLKDSSRPYHTFFYVISKLDSGSGLQPDALSDFRNAVLSNFPQLVEQDRNAALFLVLNYFSDRVQHVMESLYEYPSILFCFLKSILEAYSDNLPTSEGSDYPWNDRSRLVRLLDSSLLKITDDLVEQYIELLCQFDPSGVLGFLQKYESYRIDKCLKVCQKYTVNDGAAFLLERAGDVGSALSLTLSDISDSFHELDAAVAASRSKRSFQEEKRLHMVKEAAIALCQRNTFRLDPHEAESLWFHLLDRFMYPLQALTHSLSKSSLKDKSSHYEWRVLRVDGAPNVLRKILSKLAGEVVTGMIGYVSPQVILNKIVTDHGNRELGDFKVTILETLSAYGSEATILGTAQQIIETDMFRNVDALKRGLSRGIGPRTLTCCLCSLETRRSSQAVQIFSCGHLVHLDCLQEVTVKSRNARCPVCVQHEVYEPPPSSFDYSFNSGKQQAEEEQVEQVSSEEPAMTSEVDKRKPPLFDILRSLQRGETPPELNAEVKLKLSPSVVYKHHRPSNKKRNVPLPKTSRSQRQQQQQKANNGRKRMPFL